MNDTSRNHFSLTTARAAEDLPPEGAVPLRALSKREENLFKQVCVRRKAIARELCDIEEKLLPKEKIRFKKARAQGIQFCSG